MNARDRRTVNRMWPHSVVVDDHILFDQDCWTWLHKNFGSCSFKRRGMPRWCWRPSYYDVGSFAVACDGAEIFFRKERDYTAFLLRWQQ